MHRPTSKGRGRTRSGRCGQDGFPRCPKILSGYSALVLAPLESEHPPLDAEWVHLREFEGRTPPLRPPNLVHLSAGEGRS